MKAYSYGGASVLSKDFDDMFNGILTSSIVGYDIVPRLCLNRVQDMCRMILALEKLNVSEVFYLYSICTNSLQSTLLRLNNRDSLNQF